MLYKVGHNGSHNATLRQRGLERMTHRELAALVPVDRRMAALRRWRMPHPPLYQRLQKLTQGRVVLADAGSAAGDQAALAAFLAGYKAENLYMAIYAQRPEKVKIRVC